MLLLISPREHKDAAQSGCRQATTPPNSTVYRICKDSLWHIFAWQKMSAHSPQYSSVCTQKQECTREATTLWRMFKAVSAEASSHVYSCTAKALSPYSYVWFCDPGVFGACRSFIAEFEQCCFGKAGCQKFSVFSGSSRTFCTVLAAICHPWIWNIHPRICIVLHQQRSDPL